MSNIHINWTDNRFLRKRYIRCPCCQCTTEMVVRYEAYYGLTTYCCRCGDSWQDGEMFPRPFQRGWRKAAIRRYRKLWDQATHGAAPTLQEMCPLDFVNGGLGPMTAELPS